MTSPSARASGPRLVEPAAFSNAVALNSVIWTGTRLIGPPLAAGVIEWASISTALFRQRGGIYCTRRGVTDPHIPASRACQGQNVPRDDGGIFVPQESAGLLIPHRHDLLQQSVRDVLPVPYAGDGQRGVRRGAGEDRPPYGSVRYRLRDRRRDSGQSSQPPVQRYG